MEYRESNMFCIHDSNYEYIWLAYACKNSILLGSSNIIISDLKCNREIDRKNKEN